MDLLSQLLQIKQFLAPWPALVLFAELAFKCMVILLACFLVSLGMRRAAASHKHLLWCICLLALSALPLFSGLLPKLVIPVEALPTQAMAPVGNDATRAVAELLTTYGTDLVRFYLLVVLALVLYGFAGLLRILLLTRSARDSANEAAKSILAGKLDEELSDLPISLKEFPGAGSPISWGAVHPVILLPTSCKHWDRARLQHVILHELAHIQRLDWLTQLVGRFACAVYWYNPLVWWVARHMNELAEESCDDLVLMQTRDHTGYADSLVTVAREKLQVPKLPLLAQALVGSFLGKRVRAILDKSRCRKHNESERVIAGVVAAYSAAALLASLTVGPATALRANDFKGTSYISVRVMGDDTPNFLASEPPAKTALPARWILTANVAELETVFVRSTAVPAPVITRNRLQVPRVSMEGLAIGGQPEGARLLYKQFPEYPQSAESHGLEGFATVEYEIDASGKVKNPVVLESTPQGIFESSALKAIEAYRYDPPRVNGIPHGLKGLRTRFVFRMDSG